MKNRKVPGSSNKVGSWKTIFFLCISWAAAIGSPAQTLTTLANFDGTNGSVPYGSLVQGIDGNLYGTTTFGGANQSGTVFKITPGGTLTSLYSFCAQTGCTDGAYPAVVGLVLATNGSFYGTTQYGGASCAPAIHGCGTVFEITPGGTLTTLYSFCAQAGCSDGSNPVGGLVQGTDGNLYGTTQFGGASVHAEVALGGGTVFKITPSGTLTTLYSFCSQTNCADGGSPLGTLVQAADGNFYGTTATGGAKGPTFFGTVFEITSGGALTTIYSFCSQAGCTDGVLPDAGLVQATDGNFYGTTFGGGANGWGTVYKITPGGTLTTLYSFCSEGGTNCTDGRLPYASALVQASDGNFYGTTESGGANSCILGGTNVGCGTVFKISPGGTLTTLHSFDGTDGSEIYAGLVQATSGDFFGTTGEGGANSDGTVFNLGVGLGPFVETLPTSGSLGETVMILGNNLTGTTNVTFNGTAATFAVLSSSEIEADVPAAASTGLVEVTTLSGTLKSNAAFQVVESTPQTQITNLQNTVSGLVTNGTLSAGLGQFLLAPLNAALAALGDPGQATNAMAASDSTRDTTSRADLDRKPARAAIRELETFIERVRLLVIFDRLKWSEARVLIDAAESIIASLRG